MEQELKTRVIKVLLILNEDNNTIKYFRLIDPNKKDLELLAAVQAQSIHLDIEDENPGATELAAQALLRQLGTAPMLAYPIGMSDEDFDNDPDSNKWIDSEIHEQQVSSFMGWDRVYIMNLSWA